MKGLILLLAVLIAQATQAQKLPEPKLSAQGWLVLPVALKNPVFDALTEVQGQLDGSLQLPVWKGLGFGAGVKVNFFGLEERALSRTLTQGDASRFVYYGKLQYERYLGGKAYVELYTKLGMAQWKWNCRTCASNERQSGFHWGSGAALFVHASDNLAFGVTLGYEADAASFGPNVIGLNEFPGRTDTGGPYRFLTVGLGFSTRFLPSKGEDMW
jgi:hypothetical protein